MIKYTNNYTIVVSMFYLHCLTLSWGFDP